MLSRTLLVLAVPALLGAGCATMQRCEARDTERLLAAAGFQIRAAGTGDAARTLASLPPHRIVSRRENGTLVYVYADPTLCRCLYVGGEAEHSEYQRLAVQHENARREAARRARGSSPSGGAVGGAP